MTLKQRIELDQELNRELRANLERAIIEMVKRETGRDHLAHNLGNRVIELAAVTERMRTNRAILDAMED